MRGSDVASLASIQREKARPFVSYCNTIFLLSTFTIGLQIAKFTDTRCIKSTAPMEIHSNGARMAKRSTGFLTQLDKVTRINQDWGI